MLFTEVKDIDGKEEKIRPKHIKADISDPKHAREEIPNRANRILKIIISAELVLVVLASCSLYRVWRHNVEVHACEDICSVALASASSCMNDRTVQSVRKLAGSIAEEIYEYAWTTEKLEYRTGAGMSYKSAGTLDKDKMIKRTGITNNGWSRISLDDKDYYIPADTTSTEIPDSLPIADGIKGEYQKYALSLFPDFGWDETQLAPLINLWNRESKWNPRSHNKRSGAHGIPQALPGSKMASEGSDYYTNPEPQIRWGLKYIARRYGSPAAAWRHSQSRGWY